MCAGRPVARPAPITRASCRGSTAATRPAGARGLPPFEGQGLAWCFPRSTGRSCSLRQTAGPSPLATFRHGAAKKAKVAALTQSSLPVTSTKARHRITGPPSDLPFPQPLYSHQPQVLDGLSVVFCPFYGVTPNGRSCASVTRRLTAGSKRERPCGLAAQPGGRRRGGPILDAQLWEAAVQGAGAENSPATTVSTAGAVRPIRPPV